MESKVPENIKFDLIDDLASIFQNMIEFCIGQDELIQEFNRLTNHHMGERRNAVVQAIDNACGYDPDVEAMPDFVRFVWDCVFLPLCNIQFEQREGVPHAGCGNKSKTNS